ncbi:MAG: hypothetical protein AVDCRST_MAG56-2741 [uncultured Cytophagales bacterium]|uniref:Uncharacterized protein n=1 Tax=uncultured Cytophagales bacterium TaxID=158755 RepID=A0A6J4J0B8_9SPHI|nr:MAG: hypothetical protein AVDCRST_MAG56-2741 [uncultured Cytophagales bacterium]
MVNGKWKITCGPGEPLAPGTTRLFLFPQVIHCNHLHFSFYIVNF